MFFISLHYIKPLDEVDRRLAEHREYLERHYAAGHFLLSGRKEPRDGGVILARAESRARIEAIVRDDPFHRRALAGYEIVEFVPSRSAIDLAALEGDPGLIGGPR